MDHRETVGYVGTTIAYQGMPITSDGYVNIWNNAIKLKVRQLLVGCTYQDR